MVELVNEFAAVEIERDDTGNGPRLLIRNLLTGSFVYLDPHELAALTWIRHDDLKKFVDPGYRDRPNADENNQGG